MRFLRVHASVWGAVAALFIAPIAVTQVSSSVTNVASAAVIGDDYPANLRNAAQDSMFDPWRFYNRECTSFVAWRLNSQNRLAFNDYYRGPQWGDASNWGPTARSLGIPVDGNPALGSVAWSPTGDHVAWVAGIGNGTVTIEEYNYDYAGHYHTRTVAAGTFQYIHLSDMSGSGVGEGQFVSYAGNVYRIAGGAPVYVSTWDIYGGPQPTTNLSDAQWASLRQMPIDGTFVNAQQTGQVYEIVGGAPMYVSTWNNVGGSHPTVAVDQAALDNAGGGGVWSHLNYRPADGTFVAGTPRGEVYRFAGGAPLYVSTWNAFGGAQPIIGVDAAALDNAGGGVPWSHVAYRPADGTFVYASSRGDVYRFAGGAPVYVSTWAAFGGAQPVTGVDPAALDNAGGGVPWSHAAYRPANDTYLLGNQTGAVYRMISGVPHWISSWNQVGGQKPTVGEDQAAIDNSGVAGPWSHLASATPQVSATRPSLPSTLASRTAVRWAAPQWQSSALTGIQVQWRRAAWSSAGFGAWQRPASWSGVGVSSSVTLGLAAGYDSCVSVRAHNRAGQWGAWTAQRCVARPLDDTALTKSSGWRRVAQSGAYGGTVLVSRRAGDTVSLRAARFDRLGLVVTTCSTCGSVAVYLNGRYWRSVSLTSAKTARATLIALPTLSYRLATVTLRTRAARTTVIDGLLVSRT